MLLELFLFTLWLCGCTLLILGTVYLGKKLLRKIVDLFDDYDCL